MNSFIVRQPTIQEVKLENTPPETWANTIIGRLALAIGEEFNDEGRMTVSPDQILEAVEDRLWHFYNLENS